MLELIRGASFNNFDGPSVVEWLLANRSLWVACIMVGEEMITLRDIADGFWHAEYLYILTSGENDQLIYMTATSIWEADEVCFLSEEETDRTFRGRNNQKVISIWWD